MKASMKAFVPVNMFKTAFCVEETNNNTRLASYMAQSLTSGFRGFRAVGKQRKNGAAVYTLESLFTVCEIMGPEFFAGGIIPSPDRHFKPVKVLKFKEFLAVLLLNGNNVGELDTEGKEYQKLHNAAKLAKLHGFRKEIVYDYAKLAESAKKCGWYAPPLPGDLEVSKEQPELPLDDMKAGEEPLRADGYRARILAAVEENNRLLRELLAEWKGAKQ